MQHPPARRVPAGQGRGAGGHIEADGAGQLLADAGQQVLGQAGAPAAGHQHRTGSGWRRFGGGRAVAPVGWGRSLGRPHASPVAHPAVLAHGTAGKLAAVFSAIAGVCSRRPGRASGVDKRERVDRGPADTPRSHNRAEKCTAAAAAASSCRPRRLPSPAFSCATSDIMLHRCGLSSNILQQYMQGDRCSMTNIVWRSSPRRLHAASRHRAQVLHVFNT